MANIQIKQEGCFSHIEVDGVRLKGVLEASVMLNPHHLPTVEVRLAFTDGGMAFAEGVLKVGSLDAPEALERALLEHLKAKYDVRLPVVSMDMASGPDMTAMARREQDGSLTVLDAVGQPLVPESLVQALVQRRAAGEDPMEATRALVKKHGGGSAG